MANRLLATGTTVRNSRDRGGNFPAAGFTLIEIMITVSLIGILAAIALPSYEFAIRKTRRTEARAALTQLMQSQERYYSVRGRYLAFNRAAILAAPAGADLTRFKWYSGDSPAAPGHYEISAVACNTGIDACVALVAAPGTTNVLHFTDTQCGNFTLQSDGTRTSSGTLATGCW